MLADRKGHTTREVAEATELTVQQASNALHRLRAVKLARSREQARAGADARTKFMWFITKDGLAALAAVQHTNGTAPAPEPEPTPEGPTDMAHLTAPDPDQLTEVTETIMADYPATGPAQPTAPAAVVIRVAVQISSEGVTHNYRALGSGCSAEDARDLINEVAADAIDAAFTTKA